MNRFHRAAGIALVATLAFGAVAYGQEAALTDEQVTERLGFITKALEAGQPRARTWLYGWLAGYSAGAATMGILAATNWKSEPDIWTFAPLPEADNSFAQDMLVGGGTFALGVVGLLMDPFTPATAAKKLRPLPETTAAERQAKLARAEELLRACARREKYGRSLTTHLLNAGVNAAAGRRHRGRVREALRPTASSPSRSARPSPFSISSPSRCGRPATSRHTKPATRRQRRPRRRPRSHLVALGVWPGGLSFRLQF